METKKFSDKDFNVIVPADKMSCVDLSHIIGGVSCSLMDCECTVFNRNKDGGDCECGLFNRNKKPTGPSLPGLQ